MIGTRLGPWVIDKELGRGGMGRVYLGHAVPAPAAGPTRVAVKVLARARERRVGTEIPI